MKAFHESQEIKDKYVNRMIAHIEADEIIQGRGYENGKGCAIGCTLNNYDPKQFEVELGYPGELAKLIDNIFEALPKDEAPAFARAVLEAPKPGADLSLITAKFTLWLLKDRKHGVYQYADAQGKKAITKVATLLHRKIAGINVRQSSWDAAETAAWAAAAWAAGASEAASEAAAWAAACAAETAAEAARDAWDARGAQRDKLLELLREAQSTKGE